MKSFSLAIPLLSLALVPLAYAADYDLPAGEGSFVITTMPDEGSHGPGAPFYKNNRYAYDIAPVGGGGVARAVAEGVITDVYTDSFGGNCVIVGHYSGGYSQYCHLAAVSVREGFQVIQGEVLGPIGSTGGHSTGAHLHFSWVNKGTGSPAPLSVKSPGELRTLIESLPRSAPAGNTGQPVDTDPSNITSKIGSLVEDFYQYALLIGGLLALAIILYGGILYIASPANESLKREGKEWIKAAVFGLVLLALAYLILYTLNPCFVGAAKCPGA